MACFLVPTVEAIVTTVAQKGVQAAENRCAHESAGAAQQSEKIPFSRKLKWLNNMLWGGSALLAFEHVWHGEVVPFFPFLTAAGSPEDAAQMLREMSTVGVTMAGIVTAAWLGMLAVVHVWEKRAAKQALPAKK